jgi:hypothetical protein
MPQSLASSCELLPVIVNEMVHPSDLGNLAEGYPGLSGQTFNDPSPPTPTAFASWAGGCGREPLTATASPGPNTALAPSGTPCADGSTDCSGRPWGSWGYMVNGGKGYAHTYLATALPSKVCVNFYDVHGGGKVGDKNFQKPGGAKEIDVDANGDNSINTNSFNVNDGANCISVPPPSQPKLTTNAGSSTVTAGSSGTADLTDTATLSGTTNGTGTITFTLYSDPGAAGICHSVIGTRTVSVTGKGNYSSTPAFSVQPGTYHWVASYSGDANNAGAATGCGDANENVTVVAGPPRLTTNAGSPTVTAGSSGTADLTDLATLSGGVNPTGTITFTLWFDPGAQGICHSLIATRTVSVNGDGNYSSAPAISVPPGTYHWVASYSGDANNAGAATGCGDANENVTVVS